MWPVMSRWELDTDPFRALHREMNQLFDDFFGSLEGGLGWPQGSGLRNRADAWSLNVDVSETEDEVRVVADVPGMEEKDIEVELSVNLLAIKGKKTGRTRRKESGLSPRGTILRLLPTGHPAAGRHGRG